MLKSYSKVGLSVMVIFRVKPVMPLNAPITSCAWPDNVRLPIVALLMVVKPVPSVKLAIMLIAPS